MSDQDWKTKIKDFFTSHPNSVGETYFQHFSFAFWCGTRLVFAGLACIIHSVFPAFFKDTASNTIEKISEEMTARKNKPTV